MGKSWTPVRAARLGFLAGRGFSIEGIMSEAKLGIRSERSLRVAATRWGLSFGLGGGQQIAVQLTPEDRDVLTAASAERGVTVLALTTALMHGVLGGRLVDAVLDDRDR
jgi:hypothetical protein